MNYNIFFYISGALWAVELIPQLIKIKKNKTVDDFSIFFPIICLTAYICFFIGCVGLKNWVLLCAHLFPFVTLSCLLFLILKYRNTPTEIQEISNIKKIEFNEKDNKLRCPYCERVLINKEYLTENGCLWCDEEYHDKLMSLKH